MINIYIAFAFCSCTMVIMINIFLRRSYNLLKMDMPAQPEPDRAGQGARELRALLRRLHRRHVHPRHRRQVPFHSVYERNTSYIRNFFYNCLCNVVL